MRFVQFIIIAFFLVAISCKEKARTDYIVSNDVDTSLLDANKLKPIAEFGEFTDGNQSDSILTIKKVVQLYKKMIRDNLAIVYLYDNDTLQKASDSLDYASCLLQYKQENDTIELVAGAGFFGGYAIDIKIKGGKYFGTFSEYEQGTIFKQKGTDKTYSGELTVKAKEQKLIINKIPELKEGENLFGQYEATFEPYYENNVGIKIKKIKVKVIFKCRRVTY